MGTGLPPLARGVLSGKYLPAAGPWDRAADETQNSDHDGPVLARRHPAAQAW